MGVSKLHRTVNIIDNGVIVKSYTTPSEACAAYNLCRYDCFLSRLRRHVDGWLPDGLIARYEGEENIVGTMLNVEHSEQQGRNWKSRGRSKRACELERIDAAIDKVYADYDGGLLTIEERHQRLAPLLAKKEALAWRLGVHDILYNK